MEEPDILEPKVDIESTSYWLYGTVESDADDILYSSLVTVYL